MSNHGEDDHVAGHVDDARLRKAQHGEFARFNRNMEAMREALERMDARLQAVERATPNRHEGNRERQQKQFWSGEPCKKQKSSLFDLEDFRRGHKEFMGLSARYIKNLKGGKRDNEQAMKNERVDDEAKFTYPVEATCESVCDEGQVDKVLDELTIEDVHGDDAAMSLEESQIPKSIVVQEVQQELAIDEVPVVSILSLQECQVPESIVGQEQEDEQVKEESVVLEPMEHIEVVDFIGIDDILYPIFPLISLVTELQVMDASLVFFVITCMIISQYIGKIRGRIFLKKGGMIWIGQGKKSLKMMGLMKRTASLKMPIIKTKLIQGRIH